MLCTTKPLKPLIYQERKAARFVAMDRDTDENVFMRKQFLYGVDGRSNAVMDSGKWHTEVQAKRTK
ncbi:Mu-like prophage major head subunit gpT family protein [Paenibacillus melissococcoides]|nr:Mu-like prophage major head subunit gpT family protein [Paenibacillus melissococcoides]CAH8720532.1 Mu-like prophage major head subunit gpT family protein [Paenibacillus melissococcoides]